MSERTKARKVAQAKKRRPVAEAAFGSGFVCKVALAASYLFYITGFLYWIAFGSFRMLPYGLPTVVAGCILAGFGLFVFSGRTKPSYTRGELAVACATVGLAAFLVAGFAEFLARGLGLSGYQELGVLAVCLMTANLAAMLLRDLIRRGQPVPTLFPSGF